MPPNLKKNLLTNGVKIAVFQNLLILVKLIGNKQSRKICMRKVRDKYAYLAGEWVGLPLILSAI
jgi:hypothetical protein